MKFSMAYGAIFEGLPLHHLGMCNSNNFRNYCRYGWLYVVVRGCVTSVL
jgi:hypothetical protein